MEYMNRLNYSNASLFVNRAAHQDVIDCRRSPLHGCSIFIFYNTIYRYKYREGCQPTHRNRDRMHHHYHSFREQKAFHHC